MKSERLHIRLTPELDKWLSAICKETGLTKTAVVVKALEDAKLYDGFSNAGAKRWKSRGRK